MSRSRVATIAVAGVAAAIGTLVFGPFRPAEAHQDGHRHPRVVELAECHGFAPDHRALLPATSGEGQSLRVTVPATTIVRLDARGRVVAASTNTGCAPRRSDDLYVVLVNGTVRRAPVKWLIGRHHWVGDFTEPGVFAAQPVSWSGHW